MNGVSVCKTVVSHPNNPRYVLVLKEGGIRMFRDIPSLVIGLRQNCPSPSGGHPLLYIKNDVLGDIIWVRDDTLPDRVLECQRLSLNEVNELAKLLRQ